MTETEHLLVCLMEECGEVQHAIAKALRFGLKHAPEGKVLDNATYTSMELMDVIAVRELLVDRKILPGYDSTAYRDAINAKKKKVLQHLERARAQGTVT